MMRRILFAMALAWNLTAIHPLNAADAPGKEFVAGEDDKAVPTAVPTAAADARGPVQVTRSAQAASAFQLPDFVVTGSGERKALARRDGQGRGLDTSGGFRTSPGEKGAGKDQMEARAERSGAQERTYTVKAEDGWLRAAYGLQNTGSLDAYWGRSDGPWVFGLQGGGHWSDGGTAPAGLSTPQRRDGGIKALGGYAFDEQRVELGVDAEQRQRRWARSALDAAWMERDAARAEATWSSTGEKRGLELRLSGQNAQARLPALGTVYVEEGGTLHLEGKQRLGSAENTTTLSADLELESLSQRAGAQRQLLLWKAGLSSRFEPFARARLSVGLGLNGISGDLNEFLLGPKLRWDQRLNRAWAWDASVSSGLKLSRLRGTAWTQDARLPNVGLAAARQVAALELGLHWQAGESLAFGLRGFGEQQDAAFMADEVLSTGLWTDSSVRAFRNLGAALKVKNGTAEFWQELELRYQRPELTDLAALKPTFLPQLSGRATLGGRVERWHGSLGVDFRSEQEARLNGTRTQAAAAAVSAQAAYDFNEALTFFAEGRNLSAATWGADPDAPDAAPYAGLGLEYRF